MLAFYSKDAILDQIIYFIPNFKMNARSTSRLLSVLEECGTFIGTTYVLLHNADAKEFNPVLVLCQLLQEAFGCPVVPNSCASIEWQNVIALAKYKRGITVVDIALAEKELGLP